MKTEIDHTFEMNDDKEWGRFILQNLLSIFILSSLIMVGLAIGIINLLDWIMR